jgi:hypothetical protein
VTHCPSQPGNVCVLRDPERLVDKAAVNSYRQTARTNYERCFNCAERQSVPLYWCDHVARQVDLDHTCREFKGIHNK